MSSFDILLNARQREAVSTTEGPVLVLAGAGSGKTRVLTERIAYLVAAKKISPYNILAFTFTNKAAQEMKDRLEQRIQGISRSLWVGTFHSTGVKILRKDGPHIGVPADFSIYDATDSLNLVKTIMSRHAIVGSVLKSASSLQDTFSRWKSDLIDPDLARERAANNIDKKIAFMYREYEKELKRARALDFDDLIAKVVQLLTLFPDIKKRYAKRFLYVLVDEFQDTNPIQMVMIDALSSCAHNLFVVGDDDQSIYSWRGARIEHMLNFENLYHGTSIVRLEQNYRSTRTILEAANHVIGFNKGRKGKNLWTEGEVGEKVKLIESIDEEAEAVNVLQTLDSLLKGGISHKEIAILYRTNAQSRSLEDVMKMGSIPYQIIGSVRYYERAEVRDVLAYCKLIVNPADTVSLKRIINVPKRALGKSSVQALEEQAVKRDMTVLELIASGDYEIGKAQRKRCEAFLKLIVNYRRLAAKKTAPAVIEAIIDGVDYRRYLIDYYPDSESRIENVEELVSAAGAFSAAGEDRSLGAFLEEIALVSDIDSYDEMKGQITLMTLHNAKGLEFDTVIITGLEDGLFPHYNSLDTESELEEERRLFYVGMTRARKLLYLSYASMRRRMGVVGSHVPSRFLFEIPGSLLDGAVEGGFSADALSLRSHVRGSFGMAFGRSGGIGREDAGLSQVHPDYEEISQEEVTYKVGMRILHENFGRGIIRKVEGSSENLRVTVLFDGGGERKFMASFAPMRPLWHD